VTTRWLRSGGGEIQRARVTGRFSDWTLRISQVGWE
jgi:hypothetical protein